MGLKTWLGICILCVGAGAALMYKLRPAQVVEKEVLHETTKTVTVTHTVKANDGTIITDTTTTKDKQKDEKKNTPTFTHDRWLVSATYDTNKNYGALVQKNVLGNLYVGAAATNAGVASVVVGLSF